MKKRIIIAGVILLCLGLIAVFAITARTNVDNLPTIEDEVAQEDAVEAGNTLEDGLYVLAEQGYKKTDDGYKINKYGKRVSSERTVKADGNRLDVKLCYEYSKGRNGEMKKFYKKQDDAVYIMVSSFLTRVATAAEIEEGTMHYEIYIGNDLVRKGEMNLEEARKYQEMAS